MKSRREFLKFATGVAVSFGAVLTPLWLEQESKGATTAAAEGPGATPMPELTPPSPPPAPNPPQSKERVLVYDLDTGRVQSVTGSTLVIQSGLGLGLRTLRIAPAARVWHEGQELPYGSQLVTAGDLINVSGKTAADKSLDATYVTINPMPHLLGVAYKAVGQDILVFPRAGKERGQFDSNPVTIHTNAKTVFHKDRGNFERANSSLPDLLAGGAMQIDGYYTRAGERLATKVFFFNRLPPDDAPDWLLQRVKS